MTGPPMPPDTFRLANTAGPTTAPTPPRGGRSPYITIYTAGVPLTTIVCSALVILGGYTGLLVFLAAVIAFVVYQDRH